MRTYSLIAIVLMTMGCGGRETTTESSQTHGAVETSTAELSTSPPTYTDAAPSDKTNTINPGGTVPTPTATATIAPDQPRVTTPSTPHRRA